MCEDLSLALVLIIKFKLVNEVNKSMKIILATSEMTSLCIKHWDFVSRLREMQLGEMDSLLCSRDVPAELTLYNVIVLLQSPKESMFHDFDDDLIQYYHLLSNFLPGIRQMRKGYWYIVWVDVSELTSFNWIVLLQSLTKNVVFKDPYFTLMRLCITKICCPIYCSM